MPESRSLFDDHTHSRFSCDARDSVLALCQAAIAAGLKGLAITDQFDTEPGDEGYGRYDLAAISRAIEEALGGTAFLTS